MDAMRQLGQLVTLADTAYAEQNQSIYAVTINAYQGTITVDDMVNGEAVSSSEEPLPESMRPAQSVEEPETVAAEEPVPTMTITEKLQADFDSYVNSLKETGDFMAVVNASAEITAKQNILKYLETTPEYPQFGQKQTINIKRCINNAEVEGHPAILPTKKITPADLTQLSEPQQNILCLVAARLILATAEVHKYEAVKATVRCAGTDFTAHGKTVKENGWKALEANVIAALKSKASEDEKEGSEEKALPDLNQK